MYKIEKVNELLRQDLGKIILEEEEFGPGVLVTVMAVQTAPDLRDATVFVSVLPDESAKRALKQLSARQPHLQYCLTKRLKMHPVPKISFVLDQSETESQKIETTLAKMKP